MSYWSEVVQETTTFTLPNPDEYERPEEIREIEVNRVKARSMAVEADALNFGDKLRASLLGQLNEAMSDWEDRDLRRSFVHMQVCVRGELLICCCLRPATWLVYATADDFFLSRCRGKKAGHCYCCCGPLGTALEGGLP